MAAGGFGGDPGDRTGDNDPGEALTGDVGAGWALAAVSLAFEGDWPLAEAAFRPWGVAFTAGAAGFSTGVAFSGAFAGALTGVGGAFSGLAGFSGVV